ncbi:unnamed protein product [Oppiella nova]|uniref:Protein bicaudal C homolog 1 KH-like domain-containing protein n=1 Tax=Oppiella nova TaxID=334625 RepID=A0A7R9MHD9_9ACAR|nr:unnamed protein product [Oppiella nova]CAG2177394.1 unnamed protein product [Oppiella nova]
MSSFPTNGDQLNGFEEILRRYAMDAYESKVDLLMDVSPEDKLFLLQYCRLDLQRIRNFHNTDLKIAPTGAHSTGGYHSDLSPVNIFGYSQDVLESYRELRQLLPISVGLDLHLSPNLPSHTVDRMSRDMVDIRCQYEAEEISISRPHSPFVTSAPMTRLSVYIRIVTRRADRLEPVIDAIRRYAAHKGVGEIGRVVQTRIDVPCNRPEIVGRGHCLLDPIANHTGTQIHHHREGYINNMTITGQRLEAVMAARKEISDRFVLELEFEVTAADSKALQVSGGRQLERICRQFGVHILMKPGLNHNRRVVVIRGTDRAVSQLFDARQEIVNLMNNP